MSRLLVNIRPVSASVLGLAALAAACNNAPVQPLAVSAHPAGVVAKTVTVASRPFGAAVSSLGLAYVTRLDTAAITAADVNTLALSGTVAVGLTPTAVAFAPGGATAYVANQYSDSVGIVDVASGVQVASVAVSGDPFNVLVSRDGARVYVTTNANKVQRIDVATRTVTGSATTGVGPTGLALHPSDTLLYVTAAFAGFVYEVNVKTMQVVRTLWDDGMPQGVAVSTDGRELYVANEAGWLDVWSLARGAKLESLPLPAGGFALAVTPDQAHIYVGLPAAGLVVVVNRSTRTIVNTITTGGRPRRIAFATDGKTAVVANESGWLDFIR